MNATTRLRAALAAAALAGFTAAAAPASAGIISIGGITINAGSINLSLGSVFEDRVLALGATLSGIGEITTIQTIPGAITTWGSGDNGVELTYVFGSYTVEAIVPGLLPGTGFILFSGGNAQFYVDPAQDFTPSSGSQATDIASATNGALWLDVISHSSTTCGALGIACFNGPSTPVTLTSTVNSTTLAGVTSGSGAQEFDVIGGLAGFNFNTNGLTSGADIQANFSFSDVGASLTDFELFGSIDARGLAIPEPAALALFGAGLIGLGSIRRLRR
jgi:FAD/FMN-containing dehydrogenase